MRKLSCLFILFTWLFLPAYSQSKNKTTLTSIDAYHYQVKKESVYTKAAVACAHPLASEVGAYVMQKGGNAFDAAIATQLALAVVYPGAGNIGGGGFLIARKKDGKLLGLDYREQAPAKASRDMYLDGAGNAQTQLSQNGRLAAGVPGTVAGLFATLPYAKLSFTQLIQPAIQLAENGFVITEKEATNLNKSQEAFIQYNSVIPVFVKSVPWKAGDTLVQKELANTLKRIQANGAKGFYEGETADLIVAEMKKANGIITKEDLAAYTVKKRIPLEFDYRGYHIAGFPPPSSGGIILWQVMKMIESYPMSSYGFQSTQATQLMVEAERRAYADRAKHMGDPDFFKVPVDSLVSKYYIAQRMHTFTPGKATPSSNIPKSSFPESEETTHISIYDKEGNMVSITTTLNGSYGSKTVVGGAGFLLNNEMDDFSIKPGVPNMYGAVGGEANAIAPGKRMLSSMCPVLVTKNNKPYLVAGTPGGTTIPTSVFQTLVNMIDFTMTPADAVNKPKFHHQWLPDEVYIEKGFPETTKQEMIKMGYHFTDRAAIGRTEVICTQGNRISVAADIRGDDSVAGF
ncbi:gamma-glutamyltranspeptidase / glutathione hydrolase [Filimonas lacunae]|uniref:Glutathione hydrolase proenzyme n=1 Tax=Filimonas lacunae TaxID=477680 RepID=A0A173MME9_9BACT|nr:gamma-glutamyltransferase [Filimonas lacunae]BAV08558.1 gamma-glutamyltranspeptidase [Filimonas lacunae]SIS57097.1 gamma-glutamyltranspeptidase / glutathione hydrolase [Filimonas lacunae]